jgi:hypothetical protein
LKKHDAVFTNDQNKNKRRSISKLPANIRSCLVIFSNAFAVLDLDNASIQEPEAPTRNLQSQSLFIHAHSHMIKITTSTDINVRLDSRMTLTGLFSSLILRIGEERDNFSSLQGYSISDKETFSLHLR